MIIDGKEIQKGQTLFYPSTPADVKKRYKAGKVMDLNADVKAVKLQYVVNIKAGIVRSAWFPISCLVRAVPAEVKP